MKNKLITFLLALVFACGLWLFVVTVEQPESEQTYYEIPVIYQNNGEELLKERDLMIVSERPTVTLRLKSTRTNLRNLNESNINILVSLANVTKPGPHLLNYTISYPGNVPASEISVVSASLEQIEIKVENRVSKPIDVEVQTINDVLDPATMIALDDMEDIELDYRTIEVTGPESAMQNVEKAVVYVDLAGHDQTIAGEYPFVLCDEEGNPADTSKLTVNPNIELVNMVLKIYRVKELPLKVKVTPGAGAAEATSTITINPEKITVYGPESVLENLEYLEVGTVDLSTVRDKVEARFFPIVLPEGVMTKSNIAEAIVEIKFPNLITRTLTLKDVTFLNVPEGLEASLWGTSLDVTLRGLAGQMGSISTDDLTVTVDMSDAQLGLMEKNVTVTISSKFPDVGVLEVKPVSVIVKEETDKK